jgi:hypothetical protein
MATPSHTPMAVTLLRRSLCIGHSSIYFFLFVAERYNEIRLTKEAKDLGDTVASKPTSFSGFPCQSGDLWFQKATREEEPRRWLSSDVLAKMLEKKSNFGFHSNTREETLQDHHNPDNVDNGRLIKANATIRHTMLRNNITNQ